MYQILDEPASKDEIQGRDDIPQTLEEFTAEVKESRSDARAFAIKLRAMVLLFPISIKFPLNYFADEFGFGHDSLTWET